MSLAIATALMAAAPLPATAATTGNVRITQTAHPLGNFTVNHYDGLRVLPDRIENLAIVDRAELPTLQARPLVDTDGDGRVSAPERAAHAAAECAALATAQRLTVNGTARPWRVDTADLGYTPGQGGLPTSRLTCRLRADGEPGTIGFANGFLTDRIGWREITAVAEGVRLARSTVPATSVSQELRRYPDDLLSSPLDQRTAALTVVRSAGAGPAAAPALPGVLPAGGPIGDALAALDRTFTGLVGATSLTVPLGILAVLLAAVLGAGHALIPGHGKTVMAAYLAGRRGRPRDAFVVGATVTVTHTAGVLAVGLLLTVFSGLAGESVLSWLGTAGGLLITAIGAGLARSAWRSFRTGTPPTPFHGHGHEHGHRHGHEHGHRHGDGHGHGHGGGHGHEHGHGHGHGHGDGDGHGHSPQRTPLPGDGTSPRGTALLDQTIPAKEAIREEGAIGQEGMTRLEDATHPAVREAPVPPSPGRRWLIGLGVAGGLVPSPSALVVLLGAIALGRTWFGVALVLAYGVGMAATLTATGLLLVTLAARLDRLARAGRALPARLSALAPGGTALLVVVLGLGLTVRSLGGVI
ncbi:High-affinity nickel-transporter [Nonomuraea sp. NPDC004354]